MTNTKGTNAEVEKRIQFAIELRIKKVPNNLVVEELHQKFKKSYQTHRKDVKEANKIIVKESSITKEELEYIIRQQFDELDETFYLARENNNPSVMAGVNKAKNAAIRNYVAIKRDLDYPEMWQNQMDNESKRQSFGGIDRLEKEDHLYVHPWYKKCQEHDEIPF